MARQLVRCPQCNKVAELCLGDGVFIGFCSGCGTNVCRINPKTGKSEWLDGKSAWTNEELRPMFESELEERARLIEQMLDKIRPFPDHTISADAHDALDMERQMLARAEWTTMPIEELRRRVAAGQ